MSEKKYFVCRFVKFSYVLSLLINERLFKRNQVELCYLYPNKASIFLEKINLGKFTLSRLDYDFSRMKNNEEAPLLVASIHDDLFRVIEKVDAAESSLEDSLLNRLSEQLAPFKDDLRSYIKHQIANDIFEEIFLVNLTHWLATARQSRLAGKDLVALIEKKSYWSYLVLDFARSKNVDCRVFHSTDLKANKTAFFIYHLAKACIEISVSFFRRKRKGGVLSDSKVGIPFYIYQNFVDFLDLKNYYLFWFYKSGINSEKILIYAPHRKFNIDREEVSRINEAGFNIISGPTHIMNKGSRVVSVHRCTFRAASLLVEYLKQIIRMRGYVKNRFMREEWKLLSLLFVQLPYWEDFFRENNIKVKFRFHDMFSARDIAAKITGAVTLSYHYAHQSDMTILHQDIVDTFFVWGKRYEKGLSGEHSGIGNFIQTGYIFDYTFNNLKDKSKSLKDALRKHSVSYIIGVFDEFIGGCFAAPQLKCYKAILAYAQGHPDIGILIKPKREANERQLRSSVETAELIADLEKQGRIMILDNRKYPAEVGQASDIVIGLTPDSTAGLECALAGIPMVVYDIYSMKFHPYYEWGYNKVIFDDIQHLLELLNANKEKPGSIPKFADWSTVLDTVDPFRDGLANQRIGTYIKTLLSKFDEGSSKEEAINAANRVYADRFGLDKVTSRK